MILEKATPTLSPLWTGCSSRRRSLASQKAPSEASKHLQSCFPRGQSHKRGLAKHFSVQPRTVPYGRNRHFGHEHSVRSVRHCRKGCLDGPFLRFLGFGSLHQKLQALTRACSLQLGCEMPRRTFDCVKLVTGPPEFHEVVHCDLPTHGSGVADASISSVTAECEPGSPSHVVGVALCSCHADVLCGR